MGETATSRKRIAWGVKRLTTALNPLERKAVVLPNSTVSAPCGLVAFTMGVVPLVMVAKRRLARTSVPS